MNKKNIHVVIFLSILFLSANIAHASTYQIYAKGDTATLGEFVYEDDFTASTADCTVSIFSPNNTQVVTDAVMVEAVSGWHSYDYAIPAIGPDGTWPASMSCGTLIGGDLIKMDKTFTVGATIAVASSSLAAVINANTDSKTSAVTTDVNANTNSVVASASSSLFATLPAQIWAYSSRTLSTFGALVADVATGVWENATRTLTSGALTSGTLATLSDVETATSSLAAVINANSDWTIVMSDFSSVQAGSTYRAKIEIRNSDSVPTTPFTTPTITLYDPLRNVTVSGVSMTAIGTGIYEYTYSVASGATQGVWESIVSTQIESGKTLTNNDYWIVAGSPAQVIINSVTATSISNISANVTITNEGLAGYEYQYEWCVVSSADNACGGGNDSYHGTGAKFINPSEDFNTNLTATVSSVGDYYFKLIVYFGTESSGSSRTFTVASTSGGGGGGGSSGGGSGSYAVSPSTVCVGADFNHDIIVNSIDFSILLAYWKMNAPFKNTCVDINRDKVVNSIDFSILLSQWGKPGRNI